MSSNKGWIKLQRDIVEHWVFKDPLLLKIWIMILCTANHEDKKILINNELQIIHRGQFWTSIRRLAREAGVTPKTVTVKLELLQNDGMIYVDSRQGVGTLLTVCNYGLYQAFSAPLVNTSGYTSDDTSGHKVETHLGTQTTYKQEVKNNKALIKNEKKKDNGLPPEDPDYFEEV